MFTSRVVPHITLLRRASYIQCHMSLLGALQSHGELLHVCVQPFRPVCCSLPNPKLRNYSTAADNTSPPRWVQLEAELEEALVPRKLSVSPLESWLSLRYSLPPLLETAQPREDVELLEEKVLPPVSVPILEDDRGSATPLQCKNDVKVRRRKMNRHKYKKFLKRTKFLRRRVMGKRGKRKQRRFEEDLKRIWKRAGLKKAPEGWNTPKIFINQFGNKKD